MGYSIKCSGRLWTTNIFLGLFRGILLISIRVVLYSSEILEIAYRFRGFILVIVFITYVYFPTTHTTFISIILLNLPSTVGMSDRVEVFLFFIVKARFSEHIYLTRHDFYKHVYYICTILDYFRGWVFLYISRFWDIMPDLQTYFNNFSRYFRDILPTALIFLQILWDDDYSWAIY